MINERGNIEWFFIILELIDIKSYFIWKKKEINLFVKKKMFSYNKDNNFYFLIKKFK